jgi:small subunit ribosomal protein S8
MSKKTFSETITRIRNAVAIKSYGVEIPKNRMTQTFAEILLNEGLIREILETHSKCTIKKQKPILFLRLKYQGNRRIPAITNLQLISRRRLRIYTNYKDVPKIFGGLGFVILSNSHGIITGQISKHYKKGGEIICSIW